LTGFADEADDFGLGPVRSGPGRAELVEGHVGHRCSVPRDDPRRQMIAVAGSDFNASNCHANGGQLWLIDAGGL